MESAQYKLIIIIIILIAYSWERHGPVHVACLTLPLRKNLLGLKRQANSHYLVFTVGLVG